ncbi:NAD-dependent deacylase [candidate division KSB1 bacterium]|nr:NAD-dependent deacylase [candidate division KSB1 bacterium]
MFSDLLIERLLKATSVVVLTGAGISAESGVPIFRGETGLWKKFRPEELANIDAFLRNPSLVWEWYNYRKDLIREVNPNPGHVALVALENKYPDFLLVTQNVDNLHRVAGSRNIRELHGNIMRNRCVDCNRQIDQSELTVPTGSAVPRCECGGLVRPDVVWFGEALPNKEIQDAFTAARSCDVFLVVGTSAVVHPAAQLPLEAKEYGAYVLEINVEPTVISNYVNESIFGKAGTILPALVKRLGL